MSRKRTTTRRADVRRKTEKQVENKKKNAEIVAGPKQVSEPECHADQPLAITTMGGHLRRTIKVDARRHRSEAWTGDPRIPWVDAQLAASDAAVKASTTGTSSTDPAIAQKYTTPPASV